MISNSCFCTLLRVIIFQVLAALSLLFCSTHPHPQQHKDVEIIDASNSMSRYLDDILNIDNIYFDGMVNHNYPSELQLNKANSSDTEVPFLDLHLTISDGFVSSKIYDNRDNFDFAVTL